MNEIPSLLVLPAPILDESPASWMMRLCQYHQSWPNQVCSALGLCGMNDFDVHLSLEPLRRLTYGTSVEDSSLICLDSQFFHIRRKEQRRAEFLFHGSSKGYATYRYCPACLRADPVPYWRLTWRMAYFLVCPKHHCVMLDRCLACNAMLEAAPTRRRGLFEGADQPICRFCPICRADLGRFQAEILPDCEPLRGELALQNVVTSALLHGYFSICGMKARFSLDGLPKILMMGAASDITGGNGQASGAIAARFARSLERAPKGIGPGELGSDRKRRTSGGRRGDRRHQWTKTAWMVRFLDAVCQIRSVQINVAARGRASGSESSAASGDMVFHDSHGIPCLARKGQMGF